MLCKIKLGKIWIWKKIQKIPSEWIDAVDQRVIDKYIAFGQTSPLESVLFDHIYVQ